MGYFFFRHLPAARHFAGDGQLAQALKAAGFLVVFFILFPVSWEPIWAREIAMSAVPSPKAFVDSTVWVAFRFLAGQLLLHTRHPGTEALATRGVFLGLGFWCRRLKVHPLLLGRRTAFGIQPAFGVLAFLARPCR